MRALMTEPTKSEANRWKRRLQKKLLTFAIFCHHKLYLSRVLFIIVEPHPFYQTGLETVLHIYLLYGMYSSDNTCCSVHTLLWTVAARIFVALDFVHLHKIRLPQSIQRWTFCKDIVLLVLIRNPVTNRIRHKTLKKLDKNSMSHLNSVHTLLSKWFTKLVTHACFNNETHSSISSDKFKPA